MNLTIGVIGDESLHDHWIDDRHDLFLVYYGDNESNKDKYKKQADHYCELKGTKFNIIHELYKKHEQIINQYDYIWIPDDDVFMYPEDINSLFETVRKYNLDLAQPSIIGYYSVPITLPCPCHILRYTNFVEQMCPCFHIEAFKKLHNTFNVSKSCWGIELLWNLKLGKPTDKIAIIDDVVAMHTRPVYCGDNYSNNNIGDGFPDILKICEEYGVTRDKTTYESVYKDQDSCERKRFIFPNTDKIIEACNRIRRIVTI